MSQKLPEDDVLTFIMNDSLVVTLDLGGERAKYREQLVTYLQMYNANNLGTLLSLKNWADARSIPSTIEIRKIFCLWSLMVRVLIPLNRHAEKYGQGVVRPE